MEEPQFSNVSIKYPIALFVPNVFLPKENMPTIDVALTNTFNLHEFITPDVLSSFVANPPFAEWYATRTSYAKPTTDLPLSLKFLSRYLKTSDADTLAAFSHPHEYRVFRNFREPLLISSDQFETIVNKKVHIAHSFPITNETIHDKDAVSEIAAAMDDDVIPWDSHIRRDHHLFGNTSKMDARDNDKFARPVNIGMNDPSVQLSSMRRYRLSDISDNTDESINNKFNRRLCRTWIQEPCFLLSQFWGALIFPTIYRFTRMRCHNAVVQCNNVMLDEPAFDCGMIIEFEMELCTLEAANCVANIVSMSDVDPSKDSEADIGSHTHQLRVLYHIFANFNCFKSLPSHTTTLNWDDPRQPLVDFRSAPPMESIPWPRASNDSSADLHSHQKSTILGMHQLENHIRSHNLIAIPDSCTIVNLPGRQFYVHYASKRVFTTETIPDALYTRRNIYVSGGILADDVGLGKTRTLSALCALFSNVDAVNVPWKKLTWIRYERELKVYDLSAVDRMLCDGFLAWHPTKHYNGKTLPHSILEPRKSTAHKEWRIQTKASLIICPAHVINQWVNEIGQYFHPDDVAILTDKRSHGKYTYHDIMNKRIVITTDAFFNRDQYTVCEKAFSRVLSRDPTYGNPELSSSDGDDIDPDEWFSDAKLHDPPTNTKPLNGLLSGPYALLQLFVWQRLIVDEAHLLFHAPKSYLKISTIPAYVRWLVSATPTVNGTKRLLEFLNATEYVSMVRGTRLEMTYGSRIEWTPKEVERANSAQSIVLHTLFSAILFHNTKENVIHDQYVAPPEHSVVIQPHWTDIELQLSTHLKELFYGLGEHAVVDVVRAMFETNPLLAPCLGTGSKNLLDIKTRLNIIRDGYNGGNPSRRTLIDSIDAFRYSAKLYETPNDAIDAWIAYLMSLGKQATSLRNEYVRKNQRHTLYWQHPSGVSNDTWLLVYEARTSSCVSNLVRLKQLVSVSPPRVSAMVQHLVETVWRESPDVVVLLSTHYETLLHAFNREFASHNIKTVYFGKGTTAAKQKALRAIDNTDNNVRVILHDARRVNDGANLVAASHVILLDTPTVNEHQVFHTKSVQTIGRVYRQRQRHAILVKRVATLESRWYEKLKSENLASDAASLGDVHIENALDDAMDIDAKDADDE